MVIYFSSLDVPDGMKFTKPVSPAPVLKLSVVNREGQRYVLPIVLMAASVGMVMVFMSLLYQVYGNIHPELLNQHGLNEILNLCNI